MAQRVLRLHGESERAAVIEVRELTPTKIYLTAAGWYLPTNIYKKSQTRIIATAEQRAQNP